MPYTQAPAFMVFTWQGNLVGVVSDLEDAETLANASTVTEQGYAPTYIAPITEVTYTP